MFIAIKSHICSIALSSQASAVSAVVLNSCFLPEIFSWEDQAGAKLPPIQACPVGMVGGQTDPVIYRWVDWLVGGDVREVCHLNPPTSCHHVFSLVTIGQDALKVVALWACQDVRPEWNKYIFQFREFSPPRRLAAAFFVQRTLGFAAVMPPLQSILLLSSPPPTSPKSCAKNFCSRLYSPFSLCPSCLWIVGRI